MIGVEPLPGGTSLDMAWRGEVYIKRCHDLRTVFKDNYMTLYNMHVFESSNMNTQKHIIMYNVDLKQYDVHVHVH